MPGELPAHHAATKDRAAAGARLVLYGVSLNLLLGVVKVAGGIWGRAYALVADGIESLIDVGVSLVVWAGFKWAGQPPDRQHPYGHGKAEAVSGLLTATVILGASAGIAAHALAEIRTPGLPPHWITLVILAGAAATKIGYALRLARLGRHTASTALGIEAWHHLSDALTSAAAFIGITMAVVGGRRFAGADGWAALAASAVIFVNGIRIGKSALNELMDIAVPESLEADIRALARVVPGVAGLDKCRVRKSGLSYLVDIQVRVAADLSVREGHTIAHAVKDALLASPLLVSDVTVHVEPDLP